MKNQWIATGLVVSILLIVTGCKKTNPADGGKLPPNPPPTANPMTVGGEGGSVSNSDSTVTLTIPSGSLSSEITFTIEETASHPGNAVGTVYDIGPDGTGFDPEATLTLQFEEADLPGGAKESELVLATVENDAWAPMATSIDEQNNTVSVEISHLSVFGILWDEPDEESNNPNTVGPEGGTVTSADQNVTLEIPAGALSTDVTFSIEETGTHPGGNRGIVYEIGPSGTVFDESLATLTIVYDDNLIEDGENEEFLKLATVEDNAWVELSTTIDVQANTASALIGHLSVFGLVWDNPNKIGPGGGTIKSGDGLLTLSVPEDALTGEVLFSIAESSDHPPDNLGKAYTIDPDGTEFQQPAGLSIAYNQQSLPSGTVEEQLVIVREESGSWVELPTQVNIFNNTLTAEVTTTGTYGIREIFSGPQMTLFTGYLHSEEAYVKPYMLARAATLIGSYVEPPYQEIDIRDSSAVAPPLFDNAIAPCQPVERTLEFTTFASNAVNTIEASSTFSIDKTSGDSIGFSYSGLTKADYIEYQADPGYNYTINSLARVEHLNPSGTLLLVKVENPSNKRVRLTYSWENSSTHSREGPTTVGYSWTFTVPVYKATLNEDCTASTVTQLDIPIETTVNSSTESGLTGTDEMILQADVKTYYLVLFPQIISEAKATWWRVNGVVGHGQSYLEWSGSFSLSIEAL